MKRILASQSPRRKELLGLICGDFEVQVSQADESIAPGTLPKLAVQQLALKKALAVAEKRPGCTVIGADTIVVIDDEILGKPQDDADAHRMLARLSGCEHKVYTGVALVRDGRSHQFVEEAAVRFYPLEQAEIDRYIATGEPADKAGAYGIQGKGALLVQSISGDFYTIMGLPVARLYRELQSFEQDFT